MPRAKPWSERESDAVYRIRTRLGVTPAQARLLAKLYAGEGEPVAADALRDACCLHWDVYPAVLKVQISKVRRRLGSLEDPPVFGHDMIPNVWSFGYRLSELAMAQVRGAMG